MRNDLFLKEMGSKIKAARIAQKVSLVKLGEKTGIHYTSIWFIENGRSDARILSLKAIADALKMDVKDLL